MISSLYVHIPFCEHICSYCDFCKMFYDSKISSKYLSVLLKEFDDLKINNKLKTIYIGGGTPSALSLIELDLLLSNLNKYLDEEYEFTIEVNPETINEDKIKLFSKYGINRVSIGVQSFDDSILSFLGRKHNYEDVKKCVCLLNKYDITNYSFDFIYGIRNQSIYSISKDIDLCLELNPKHLSFYSLILEDNTLLSVRNYEEIDQDIVREHYDYIYSKLKENKYNRYEVSNFSLKGYESKHNLVYWNNEEYYAIGVGASSYVDGVRYTSSKNITNYVKGIINKDSFEVDKDKEYIMLGLRLEKGINLIEYKSIFNKDFLIEYSGIIDKYISDGLLILEDNYLKVSYEGMMILDSILVDLM